MFARQCGPAAVAAIVALNGLSAAAFQGRAAPPAKAGVNRTAQVHADFQKRVEEYASLHQKLEATLPKLSKEATPQDVDRDQRAIADLILQARRGAKAGDIFTPAMQTFVRSLLADVFKGARGAQAKEAVYDEPHPVKIAVNGRYPDDVPLSTMPPPVLAALPKLPPELEYRFVNDALILMDVHAHLIVDYVLKAMPPAPRNAPR